MLKPAKLWLTASSIHTGRWSWFPRKNSLAKLARLLRQHKTLHLSKPALMVSWLYLARKEPFKSPIVCSKSSTFGPTSEDRDIPKRNWTEAEFKVRNEKVKISDFKSRSRIFFFGEFLRANPDLLNSKEIKFSGGKRVFPELPPKLKKRVFNYCKSFPFCRSRSAADLRSNDN